MVKIEEEDGAETRQESVAQTERESGDEGETATEAGFESAERAAVEPRLDAWLEPQDDALGDDKPDLQPPEPPSQQDKRQGEAGVAAPPLFLFQRFQLIAAEANAYSKRSLEISASFVQKLLAVSSMEAAVQLQAEFAKTSCSGFVAHMAKMSELYANLAELAFKPFEASIAKIHGAKE
jgi:hypothetical protein